MDGFVFFDCNGRSVFDCLLSTPSAGAIGLILAFLWFLWANLKKALGERVASFFGKPENGFLAVALGVVLVLFALSYAWVPLIVGILLAGIYRAMRQRLEGWARWVVPAAFLMAYELSFLAEGLWYQYRNAVSRVALVVPYNRVYGADEQVAYVSSPAWL